MTDKPKIIPLRIEDIQHLTAEDFDRLFPGWRSGMTRLLQTVADTRQQAAESEAS